MFHIFLFTLFFFFLKVRLLRNVLEGSRGASLGERWRKYAGEAAGRGRGQRHRAPRASRGQQQRGAAGSGGLLAATWRRGLADPKRPQRLGIAVY